MNPIKPCAACQAQKDKRRGDPPHDGLSLIKGKSFSGLMSGGHEEYVYRCNTCGVLMFHMDDKNDFMPFWYMIDTLPDWAK
jgi:hypothetical protein